MPLHDYVCKCGYFDTRFCKIADLGLPQKCDVCPELMERRLSATFVVGDIEPYKSPIDDHVVYSRKQRKEDLLRNNCVEFEPSLKAHQMRAKADSDDRLEKGVEATLEEAIVKMPVRKRELLEQEVRAGTDAQIINR